jgi:glycosyltransferase involved in cell wall biosynthesis
MAKAIKLYCRQAKIVISALQPPLHYHFIKIFALLLKPDLILTASDETGKIFTGIGWRVAFLASGVDTNRFIPVTESAKKKLREKYHIDKEKFIVTHVGPIRNNRNLGVFNKIQSIANVQTIIVANTAFPVHRLVYNNLKEHGCIIWRSYFKNIEEICQLSDCYIFPTRDQAGCIELPLSVLEAMSCNLPVIATRFMALPQLFREGDGLHYADGDGDFVPRLETIKSNRMKIRTREKVLPYDWYSIAQRLEEIYRKVSKEP